MDLVRGGSDISSVTEVDVECVWRFMSLDGRLFLTQTLPNFLLRIICHTINIPDDAWLGATCQWGFMQVVFVGVWIHTDLMLTVLIHLQRTLFADWEVLLATVRVTVLLHSFEIDHNVIAIDASVGFAQDHLLLFFVKRRVHRIQCRRKVLTRQCVLNGAANDTSITTNCSHSAACLHHLSIDHRWLFNWGCVTP